MTRLAQSWSSFRSASGTPMIWARVHTGRSATSSAKSASPAPATPPISSSARVSMVSSRARIALGVKASAMILRSRECAGGSWLSIMARANSRSVAVSGSRIWVAPRWDENTSGVRRTCLTSEWVKTAQYPGPAGQGPTAGSSIQHTGAVLAQLGEQPVGHRARIGLGQEHLDGPPGPGRHRHPPSVHDGRVAMEPPDGDAILRDNFAPWVQDLGLTVESLLG